jgi:GNAT superfamily N-acetyltransferase
MSRKTHIDAERAERAALADLHAAASSELADRLGLELGNIDGTLVSIARHEPTILVNRIIGFGVEHPADRGTVEKIVARYREAGVDRYFLHLDPNAAPEELAGWLEAAGLSRYHRGWAKFVRGAEPPPPVRSDLEIRRVGAEHAQDFGRIAAAAFGLGDDWIPAIAGLVGRPGWQVYLSFDGDVPAGSGAMRIHEGVAWFDWAATLPEFRRRGSQGAIMARRIADAREAGCHLLATATGEAVDGDPQHSYRNILRAGFELSHTRANWVPRGYETS